MRPILYAIFMIFDPLLDLFDGGKPTLVIPDDDVILPGTPRDPARRAATDALWTYQDDLLLKQLVEKYPKNWGLVADLFNSSRGAISLEKRADWECKERYRSRWLGKDRGDRDFTPMAPSTQDGLSSSTSARPPQSQITTRKRMASVSSTTANTTQIPGPTFEPRKRRRHVLIFETMRKCAKKREAAQKSSGMCLPFASSHRLTPSQPIPGRFQLRLFTTHTDSSPNYPGLVPQSSAA